MNTMDNNIAVALFNLNMFDRSMPQGLPEHLKPTKNMSDEDILIRSEYITKLVKFVKNDLPADEMKYFKERLDKKKDQKKEENNFFGKGLSDFLQEKEKKEEDQNKSEKSFYQKYIPQYTHEMFLKDNIHLETPMVNLEIEKLEKKLELLKKIDSLKAEISKLEGGK